MLKLSQNLAKYTAALCLAQLFLPGWAQAASLTLDYSMAVTGLSVSQKVSLATLLDRLQQKPTTRLQVVAYTPQRDGTHEISSERLNWINAFFAERDAILTDNIKSTTYLYSPDKGGKIVIEW